MGWMFVFDVFFKVVTMVTGIGIFAGITRLLVWAVRLEPRIQHVETETASHGALIQQLLAHLANIEGWMSGQTRKSKTNV